jgi:cell fate (sporulation/competence/biofilm development) regulator YlbF (YheA/YmcA/DUF963 family)
MNDNGEQNVNQKTETQIESSTVNLGEVASKLGVAIVATTEYQAFNTAQRRYRNDSEAQELLKQYQEAQRTTQLMQQLGNTGADHTQRLEEMENQINANRTLSAYFETQEKLVVLLRELDEFVSGKLNLEFAGLTKPQRGCC